MNLLYEIWLDAGMRIDCVGAESLHLKKNGWVVVEFEGYLDYGRVIRCRGKVPDGVDLDSLPVIQHKATYQEQSRAHENYLKNKTVNREVETLVEKHKLGIKIVTNHITFDRRKIIVKFTSPSRVDFRQLVRDLAGKLKMRVELRQIGVRDVAKMRGGIGTCGRVLCCSSWSHEFQSVNVRMVKDQNVPLVNRNINGQCGRIKCCMEFEHEGYKMLGEDMPLPGSRAEVKQKGFAQVLDVNLLKKSALVRLKQDGRIVQILREDLEKFQNFEGQEKSCDCGTSCSTADGECSTGGCG